MFIQFGYVVLFSSAFPLAALCALLNNIIEIRSDAFKLCTNLRRPFGERVENIGTWQVNFANRLNLLSMTGSRCTYCTVNATSSYKEHRLIRLIMFFPNHHWLFELCFSYMPNAITTVIRKSSCYSGQVWQVYKKILVIKSFKIQFEKLLREEKIAHQNTDEWLSFEQLPIHANRLQSFPLAEYNLNKATSILRTEIFTNLHCK